MGTRDKSRGYRGGCTVAFQAANPFGLEGRGTDRPRINPGAILLVDRFPGGVFNPRLPKSPQKTSQVRRLGSGGNLRGGGVGTGHALSLPFDHDLGRTALGAGGEDGGIQPRGQVTEVDFDLLRPGLEGPPAEGRGHEATGQVVDL